ncbi:uncharacterized protein L201_005347 [Kwoniella dendrophila CBS 6074]|uniref:BZIP domain-containing protein n=1 Tax=Kwoniella dendrophila CBS 6074 TaxID=1295534 RepID=A0AAX4JYS0_9TREE
MESLTTLTEQTDDACIHLEELPSLSFEDDTGSPADFLQQSEPIETDSTTSGSPTITSITAPLRELEGGDPQATLSLPNLTALQAPVLPYAMEPNWPSQGLYNYYTPERMSTPHDRQSGLSQPSMHTYDESLHRRAVTLPHNANFLPPPAPPSHTMHNAAGSNNLNLPPLPPFYGSYPNSSANLPGSQPNPANVHTLNHNNLGYSVSSGTSGGYHYPMTSPMGMSDSISPAGNHRAPPPHSYSEASRISGGFSTSPGGHHFSPTSPTNHLNLGVNPSSASTSSSSFPSIQRTPATLPRTARGANKRRSTSDASQSTESWDELDHYPQSTEIDSKELAEITDDQPWGMPQAEYKALNPRDKKQVRNRIGARRFRAKRKDYVNTLEREVRSKNEEIATLRNHCEAHQAELNKLRAKLGLPMMEITTYNPDLSGGLGLMMNQHMTNGNSSSGSGSGNDLGDTASTEWGKTKIEVIPQ